MTQKDEFEIENTRTGEEGAAIVMVLMVSMLLLVASAGLIMEVSMNTSNITDATAEQQAYNAAESGIQSALNVLRGNTSSSPLLKSDKTSDDPANIITFRRAVTSASSNKPADSGSAPRLSRWLNYNYTPPGKSLPDRITLGSDAYDPATGYAYSVEVSDPDNTGARISYSTKAKIDGSWNTKSFGSSSDSVTFNYISATKTNLDVSTGSANTDFGRIQIVVTGAGASIPAEGVRIELEINMTAPFSATKSLRGKIEGGTITSGSTGMVKIKWDSVEFSMMGSTIILSNNPLSLNAPTVDGGNTTVSGSISPVEPIRLLIRSKGYGPRGAVKLLEAMVRKNFFDGMTAPATLTMVGPSEGFAFASGNSQNVTYSGNDVVSNMQIPAIGVTNDTNLASVYRDLETTGSKTNIDVLGYPANVSSEIPRWLQSAENLDDLLQSLKNVAKSSGTYFPSGATVTTIGNNAYATGLTYIEGNHALKGAGGGILVVTGNLDLRGGFDFNGLIIVTGANGLSRSGGGNGTLQGNIVIAPYNPANLNAGFSSPRYDISGGGTSTVTYNSSSLANGLTAVSNFVLGVADK